ncbi:MAG: hypothetical protein HY277_02310 [Ignavibacteriales bacterium]|nr:hypothetical protein [Ignavibacteriales bacterium]
MMCIDSHGEAQEAQTKSADSLRIMFPISSQQHIASDSIHSELLPPDLDPPINYTRLSIVGGTIATAILATHLYQQSGWWADNRAPFHFQEDLKYGLNVDKFGHVYAGAMLAFIGRKSLEWANIPKTPALFFGSGASLLFQTYVEVEDGFSAWGFDRVDFASDVAGAAWPIAQYYLPPLQDIDLKLSYHTSDLLGNPGGIGFKGQKHLVIDDYEGQTLWMSVKVHNILPEVAQPYWPDFLCLALGYGARDIADPSPYRVYFVALDVDMTKIIPPKTSFLKTLGEALNLIHMPLPAVQLSPYAVWYGVYF